MSEWWDEVETFRGKLSAQRASSNDRRGGKARGLPDHIRPRARGGSARPRQSFQQHVVVKSSSVRLRGAGRERAASHLVYLQRDGTSREGEGADVFTREGETTDPQDFLDRSQDDQHQFRFIVSPEFGDRLDLEAYTRDLMENVEVDLGTRLDWLAVEHHNTEHPHVHIVVRGVDESGQTLYLDPAFLTHGFRSKAEELATFELGPRTVDDIERARDREVSAERCTSIDRRFLARSERPSETSRTEKPVAVVSIPSHRGLDNRAQTARRRDLSRLKTLEDWGLARDVSDRREPQGSRWEIPRNLDDILRARQIQKDIIRRMYDAGKSSTTQWDLSGMPPKRVVGKVARRGIHDEVSGEEYLIVDTADGRSRYLSESELSKKGACAPGDFVEIQPSTDPKSTSIRPLSSDSPRLDGPHWMDRELVENTRFGGSDTAREFARLARERRAALEEKGVLTPGEQVPRDLLKRTREHERSAFAARCARKFGTREAELDANNRHFRGAIVGHFELRGGRYTVVANASESVVLTATKHTNYPAGQNVTLELRQSTSGRERVHVTAETNERER